MYTFEMCFVELFESVETHLFFDLPKKSLVKKTV